MAADDIDPIALPQLGPAGEPCAQCAAPLASDQRYCLECGRRRGAARLDVLAHARARTRMPRTLIHADPPAPEATVPGADTGRGRGIAAGLAAVSPRVAALLCLGMLTGGIALGAAAGPATDPSIAAAGRRIIAVVQAPPPAPVVAAAPAATPPAGSSSADDTGASAVASTDTTATDEGAVTDDTAVDGPAVPDDTTADDTSTGDAGTGTGDATSDAPGTDTPDIGAASPLPPVKHVWVVMLTGQRYAETFGPNATDPLFRALTVRGTVLSRVFGVAHGTLPTAVALLTGQGPNPDTQTGCATPTPLTPGTISGDDPRGQARGTGCVLPATVPTLLQQLEGGGLAWKGYVESLGTDCRGTAAGPAYVAARNPFALLASVTGDATVCGTNVTGLPQLGTDLTAADGIPALSYIVPDACHSGAETPCAPGAPAGLAAAGPWVTAVVDQITATQAYKDGGLIIVTGDEAPQTGPLTDARGCRCTLNADGAGPFWPNSADPGLPVPPPDPLAAPTRTTRPPRGGGRVGALLLSPFVSPGRTIPQSYDAVSLLKTVEDLFGLPHVGAATDPAHRPLGPKAFAGYTPPSGP